MNPAFAQVDHRPWPVPDTPWIWQQAWTDLLFVHYQVDVALIRPLIPPALELDTHDGRAWIGVVPFRMKGVTKRGWPAPAFLCDFPEINVRTYVKHQGKPGVWFFSLDIPSAMIAWFARTFFHVPYRPAEISCRTEGEELYYASRCGTGVFKCRYTVGAPVRAERGGFAEWATERYCLYSQAKGGGCFRGEVQHPKWPLHEATIDVAANTLAGFPLGPQHPAVYCSPRVDVVVWPLQPILG